MFTDRALTARRLREDAAALAYDRIHPTHQANGDEQRYSAAHYPMSFTKGLDHNPTTGLVAERAHFEAFRNAIDEGWIEPFTTSVPVPTALERRQWEAPTAGTAYDLQGPDAQAVTMPPAPPLGSDELAFEMAEVYELAMLRDTPFLSFDQGGGPGSGAINDAVDRLNGLSYAQNDFPGRPRKSDDAGNLSRQTVFRGSAPKVEIGPYLSQFMVLGNANPSGGTDVADGLISYGALCIDQKVLTAASGDDYMQTWNDWLQVQQGYDVNGVTGIPGQNLSATKRFIYTPRDLATYVHFDALYEAYLNAALILLGMGTPYDPGFAKLSGQRNIYTGALPGGVKNNAGGFALYGGPHILTLVTEVATRALKAVRYQKFNNHLRLRPEALAARVEKAAEIDAMFPSTCGAFTAMADEIDPTVSQIRAFNAAANGGDANALLPMAFAEGSPMHPTYGAGHATVAGACVTILKAYFDTGTVLQDIGGRVGFFDADPGGNAVQYEVIDSGATLDQRAADCPLTLEGELNKLAANISIGRNMAGVHYFSDYYDSLRMGEAIAIGMLEEQALCYATDEFVVSVPTFDGDMVRIGAK